MRQTLEDIRRRLSENAYKNEEHVRIAIVLRLLAELGWDVWNPNEVNLEFAAVPSEDSTRVDMALFLNPYAPAVYIEVKWVGKLLGDIRQYETQLRDYNRNNTAVFTILTDGRRWRFYYSQTGGEFSKKCFKVFDMMDDDLDELERSFQAFLSKEEIGSGNAKRDAESYLQLSQKQRAMEDVLSQARKAVLELPYPSLPQAVVQLAAKAGIHVTLDEATQFVQEFRIPLRETPPTIESATSAVRRRKTASDVSDTLGEIITVPAPPSPVQGHYDDYINKRLQYFIFLGKEYHPKTWRELLLTVATELYHRHKADFRKCLALRGSKMTYFSTNPNELSDPKQIADSEYYTEAKQNANSIVRRSRELMARFGYKESDLQIVTQ